MAPSPRVTVTVTSPDLDQSQLATTSSPPITAHLAPCVPAAASSVAIASSGRARGSMSCDGAGLCDT